MTKAGYKRATAEEIVKRLPSALRKHIRVDLASDGTGYDVVSSREKLRDLCRWLSHDLGYLFATLVAEETPIGSWSLNYLFYHPEGGNRVHVYVELDAGEPAVPSISDVVNAADWHEREVQNLFGLSFAGHPKLGNFVLHEDWPEGETPMRHSFDGSRRVAPRIDVAWRAPTVVHGPGTFAMPIGPVYSDFAEAAHFLLETVGEEVIRVIPRFFFKYRGVEKIAEGRATTDALLLAERFSGTSAFAHGLAFCQAVEKIAVVEPPPRARWLRCLLAEIERLRHHVAAIRGICESTALAVGESQAAILEEDLLRLTCREVGHRYLFGLVVPGGLARDLTDEACLRIARESESLMARLGNLRRKLEYTSSFLDRLEEVGFVSRSQAVDYGLVGPIARASGFSADARRLMPYAAYAETDFEVPTENEGDGYARLRLLFREAEQSVAILRQVAAGLPDGPVRVPWEGREGVALGVVEAPLGAAFHWVRLDAAGKVVRYRLSPPSFTNWQGFHLAAENFAFQDFPIILATFGLSNAESDR